MVLGDRNAQTRPFCHDAGKRCAAVVDKARLGNVFYYGVAARADPLID